MPVRILNLEVKTHVVQGNEFFFFELGGKRNYKKIWINSLYMETLSKKDINGILKNANIKTTQKLNYVIKKGDNNVFFILVECGYRGSSEIKVISEYSNLVNFSYYHSERGNLGISDGVIVETPSDHVKIAWSRSGRLYGSPSRGLSIIHADGKIELIDIEPEEIDEIIAE